MADDKKQKAAKAPKVPALGFSVESRVALKAGAAVLVTGACYKLRRDGHHCSAKALRCTFADISFGLAANNAYHAIKQR